MFFSATMSLDEFSIAPAPVMPGTGIRLFDRVDVAAVPQLARQAPLPS